MKLTTYLALMLLIIVQWVWVVVFHGFISIRGISWFTATMAERATSGFMLGLVLAGWYITLERIDTKKIERSIETARTREMMMGILAKKDIKEEQLVK